MIRKEKNPWSRLKLNGNNPGAVRAEIFRAFLLKEFGAGARDMVDASTAFARETGMSFSTFFGGLKVKDIGKKEWGRQHCVWEYRGQKKMFATAVPKRGDGPIGDVDEACQKELEDAAGSQVPEDIDFETIAAEHGVTREAVLAAYAKALGRALRARQPAGEEPKRKRKGGGGGLLFPSVLLWAIRAFWDGLSGQKRKRARYQQIWIEKLLGNSALDARITLDDGKVVTGRLSDVDDDFFTLETGTGTEVVDRAGIQAIQGIENAKGQTGAGGVGTIRVWFADRGFGFIESDRQTFFFRRDGIGVKGLAEHLDAAGPDKRAIRQLVHFSVEAAAGGGRSYPRVRIDRWLVDQSQPGEVARTGADEYQLGRESLKNGDIESAKAHFKLAMEKGAGQQQARVLKDWAGLLNRSDPNAAYDLLEKYRPRIRGKDEQISLDRMEVTCLLRAKRAQDALPLIQNLLAQPSISGGQREYYEGLKSRIDTNTLWGRQKDFVDESIGAAWEAYVDVLASQCDFHGLDGEGIAGEGGVPESGDDDSQTLKAWKAIVSRINDLLGTVPDSERVIYRSAEFSADMARLNLTALRLALALGNTKDAQHWLRDYAWRKALCCMFAEEGYQPEEVLAHLVWRARPGPVVHQYFEETLPLLVCGVLQWSPREELMRIVEDGNHRKELLRRFPVDPEMKASLQRWVGQHELALLMPKITEIFERSNLVEGSKAGGMAEVRRRIHAIRERWDDQLSRHDFAELAKAIKSMATSHEERESAALAAAFLEKAGEYAGTLEYERRGKIAKELRGLREVHAQQHVLEGTTLLATDICQPTLDKVWELVERDFARKTAQTPVLRMTNAYTSQYFPEKGEVQLQLSLSATDPSLPGISEIAVHVEGGNASADGSTEAYHKESLKGGGTQWLFSLTVVPTEDETRERHGVAHIRVEYRKETEAQSPGAADFKIEFSLAERAFELIPNPYNEFSNKTSEGQLFVGRDELVAEIADMFKGSKGGQCYVLYGQRRSGKSSVLRHVQQKLEKDDFIFTQITMPEKREGEVFDPIRRFAEELESRWEDDGNPPLNEERRGTCSSRLRRLGQAARREKNGRNWVVGIDEFTHLYDFLIGDRNANRGAVQSFLRFLKALLEEEVFHLLLIGQESIVQLEKEFPNEFAIYRLNRLTYLDKDAVEQLVDVPIRRHNENGGEETRYRGDAFQRLYEATAGQPYFTQGFCNRMVRYLNARKIPDITEEVIRQVLHQLCEGDENGDGKIPDSQFEPFVNLMEPTVDEDEVVRCYYRIAEETGHDGEWAPIQDFDPEAKAKVLPFLEKRGIAVIRDWKTRMRMGLFAAWLRANPGRTRESFGGR